MTPLPIARRASAATLLELAITVAQRAAFHRSSLAVSGRDQPNVNWIAVYEAGYARYRALYGALKPTFDGLE